LIKEGCPSNSAFIIKEGDCQLFSSHNPCDLRVNAEGEIAIKQGNQINAAKRRKGYMSKTTNTFQLGLKGKLQWVGEDILILDPNENFYFNVVAVGKVTAMEISK
jgi:hypothetical protein